MNRRMFRYRYGLIRFVDAPDGEGAGAPQAPAPDTTPDGNATDDSGGDDSGKDTGEQVDAPDDKDTDGKDPDALESLTGDELRAIIHDLRKENATRRVAVRTADEERAQMLSQVAAALGITAPDDEEKAPTVEELTARAETASKRAAEAENATDAARRELAIFQRATALGVDANALMDSRAFMRDVAAVAHDNVKAIDNAITTALDANPRLKHTPPAGSGFRVDRPGGASRDAGNVSLQDAVARNYQM